jgi:hypothetical protein
MYVCMYAYMHVCVFVCVFLQALVFADDDTLATRPGEVRAYVYSFPYVYVHACMYVCISAISHCSFVLLMQNGDLQCVPQASALPLAIVVPPINPAVGCTEVFFALEVWASSGSSVSVGICRSANKRLSGSEGIGSWAESFGIKRNADNTETYARGNYNGVRSNIDEQLRGEREQPRMTQGDVFGVRVLRPKDARCFTLEILHKPVATGQVVTVYTFSEIPVESDYNACCIVSYNASYRVLAPGMHGPALFVSSGQSSISAVRTAWMESSFTCDINVLVVALAVNIYGGDGVRISCTCSKQTRNACGG